MVGQIVGGPRTVLLFEEVLLWNLFALVPNEAGAVFADILNVPELFQNCLHNWMVIATVQIKRAP